jgi:predicted nucleic acid-binding protein
MLIDSDVLIWLTRGHDLTLLTANVKHFRAIDSLHLEGFEP